MIELTSKIDDFSLEFTIFEVLKRGLDPFLPINSTIEITQLRGPTSYEYTRIFTNAYNITMSEYAAAILNRIMRLLRD